MPRKPDRFERMVNSSFGVIPSNNQVDAGVANYMYREDAVKLLRRQHRAYVRMVRKYRNAIPAMRESINPDYVDGYDDFSRGIINALTSYKR